MGLSLSRTNCTQSIHLSTAVLESVLPGPEADWKYSPLFHHGAGSEELFISRGYGGLDLPCVCKVSWYGLLEEEEHHHLPPQLGSDSQKARD